MDAQTGQTTPPEHESFEAPPQTLRLQLVQITSFLVVSQRRVRGMEGDFEQLRAFAKKVFIHNVLFGWWGFPFGLIWTPMALSSNAKALRRLREIASTGQAGAGWFADPSGRHGARYWDGTSWTDKVSDLSSDALPSEAAAQG